MGMVLRFPIERARPSPMGIFANECAQILILPTVRIERQTGMEGVPMSSTNSGNGNSSGSRRRPRDRHN